MSLFYLLTVLCYLDAFAVYACLWHINGHSVGVLVVLFPQVDLGTCPSVLLLSNRVEPWSYCTPSAYLFKFADP